MVALKKKTKKWEMANQGCCFFSIKWLTATQSLLFVSGILKFNLFAMTRSLLHTLDNTADSNDIIQSLCLSPSVCLSVDGDMVGRGGRGGSSSMVYSIVSPS